MRIRLGHLYPEYLNIYADRGNVAVLTERARVRGHELAVFLGHEPAERRKNRGPGFFPR